MRYQHQQHIAQIPVGRVDVPGLLYGSVGLLLSFALSWLGMYDRVDAMLFEWLHGLLFRDEVPVVPSLSILLMCAAVFCYGLAFAVLDSHALWRRVVLGVTALVLTLAMVPALAVWNIYFSPVLQLVGLFWSWFCVVIYAHHHQMPCDVRDYELKISAPEAELMEPVERPVSEPVVLDHKHEILELNEGGDEKYKPRQSGGRKSGVDKKPGAGKKRSKKGNSQKRKSH